MLISSYAEWIILKAQVYYKKKRILDSNFCLLIFLGVYVNPKAFYTHLNTMIKKFNLNGIKVVQNVESRMK